MKYLTLATLLLSLSLFAKSGDPDCAGNCNKGEDDLQISSISGLATQLNAGVKKMMNEAPIDDPRICNPFEDNDFPEMIKRLKKLHNATLEEAYFRIKCSNARDLLSYYIEKPVSRDEAGWYLEDYFLLNEEKPGLRPLFSKILLHEVAGRNALERIEVMLKIVPKGTETELALLDMKKRYTSYLKQYPVSK